MSGLVTYRKVTSEMKEAEVVTMADLLLVLQEAGPHERVRIEVFDAEGHRHDVWAEYKGESTGLAQRVINAVS